MPIVRKKLTPDEISPPYLRFDPTCECVQQTTDGGTTWFDSPNSDPRTASCYQLPSRGTGTDAKCAAAANMVAQLESMVNIFEAEIAQLQALNALFDIIAFFLPEVGIVLEVLLAITEALLTIGADAISAAFTSDQWDIIRCILYCDMADDCSVSAAAYSKIISDVHAQCAPVVYDVIFTMFTLLGGIGNVGLTNMGAIGSASGDCSSCECEWCYEWHFSDGDGSFEGFLPAGAEWHVGSDYHFAHWDGSAWVALIDATRGEGDAASFFSFGRLIGSARFTHLEIDVELAHGNTSIINQAWTARIEDGSAVGTECINVPAAAIGTLSWDGDITISGAHLTFGSAFHNNDVLGYAGGSTAGGSGSITRILLRGKGDNPLGANNC